MRLRQLVAALACLVCVPACGDDSPAPVTVTPTPVPTPTPPPVVETVPRVQGTWRGTSELQVDGVKLFATVTMTLTQNDRAITGTWIFSPPWDWNGTIQGVLNGTGAATTFAGTATVVAEVTGNTGRCHGQMLMSGSSSDISLRWTANQVTWQDCRGNAAGFVWILGR
jgi:hypothetical protein